jgi:hypothetical protein
MKDLSRKSDLREVFHESKKLMTLLSKVCYFTLQLKPIHNVRLILNITLHFIPRYPECFFFFDVFVF